MRRASAFLRFQRKELERLPLAAHREFTERAQSDARRQRGEAVEQTAEASTRALAERQASTMRATVFIASPISAISFLR